MMHFEYNLHCKSACQCNMQQQEASINKHQMQHESYFDKIEVYIFKTIREF